ncbi:MAG TPA: hypothetical protein VLM75_06610 [Spirochaetota bacterium]|nr:hypothetical protein [Spirochaetota bacterium]
MLPRFAPGAAVLLLAGCSYTMDYIEGAITARSSFSIEAEYSGGVVTIRWDEGPGVSSFAGFEIYMTRDEYDDYDLLASRFENESGFGEDGTYKNLDSSSTRDYSYTPPAPGIYFYRVGIIEWDDDDDKMVDRYGSDYFDDPVAYNAETSIKKISGYRMVTAY